MSGKVERMQELVNAVHSPETLIDLPLKKWDGLLRVAKKANLIGRIATNISEIGIMDDLPEPVVPHIRSALILTSHQREAIKWEIYHLTQALSAIDGPKIFLKGAAYVEIESSVSKGRLFSDVDILITQKNMAQAESELMLRGWGNEGADEYDQKYYRLWMHEIPPMVHRKRGTVVDLHHNILPLTAKLCPKIDMMIEKAVDLPSGFKVLSPTDMVIHSAVHLLYESELHNGLRDLCDLELLIMEFSAQDDHFISKLIQRAEILNLSHPVFIVFYLLDQVLDYKPKQLEFVEETKLLFIQNKWLVQLYQKALIPEHPLTENTISILCRFLIYIRGHYLRMPLKLLVPHLARKTFFRLYKNNSRSRTYGMAN